MPREIADSDDEVEFAFPAPKKTTIEAALEHAAGTIAEQYDDPNPVLNVDFDAFLSPTQRLSSFDRGNDGVSELQTSPAVDSSTDRFLNEIAHAPSSNQSPESHAGNAKDAIGMSGKRSETKEKAAKKRSRTQIDDGSLGGSSDRSSKRAKTFGSSATSNGQSPAMLQFKELINSASGAEHILQEPVYSLEHIDEVHSEDLISIEARTQYTEPLDLSLHLSPTDGTAVNSNGSTVNLADVQKAAYMPPQLYTPQGNSFGGNWQGATTSMSSMGNYRSFTINPDGRDYNEINPFGRLSQASLGAEDDADTSAIAEIFRNSASNRNHLSAGSNAAKDTFVTDMQEMQTSPIKDDTIVVADQVMDAPGFTTAEEEPPQASPAFSPITNPDETTESGDPDVPEQILDAMAGCVANHQPLDHEQITTKDAPKKRGRKPKKKANESVNTEHNDIDELAFDDHSSLRGIRAGTVDSVSNVSEISQATTGSKAGRKRKSRKSEMLSPIEPLKKLPSSDLGLDNKAIIGLSPERYKPRPSRRRGRAAPEAEVEVADQQVEGPDISQAQVPTLPEEDPVEELPAQATQAKGKKGKKKKMQRAKTSAAALLKRGAEFLDEDELEEAKDVIFVDEKPAKLKFSAIPELSPDRKPEQETPAVEPATEVEEDVEEDIVQSVSRRGKITIDVPVLPKSDDAQELPPSRPEPKKRGRKPKKKTQEITEEDATEEQQVDQRPALAEQDRNVQSAPSKDKKSAELVQDVDPTDENEHDENTTNRPTSKAKDQSVSTPTKATSTTPKATHSPLKPGSATPLFNARARIGLSKRHSIPSLLTKVNRNKEAPKAIERKEKLNKRQLEEREAERIAKEEAEAEGREYIPLDVMRDKNGMLVEWDF